MILINLFLYLALNFLLLGFIFGCALIVTVLATCLLIHLLPLYYPGIAESFTKSALKYLEFYIYGMWAIGAIWRLMTFKHLWADIKTRWQADKKTNAVIKKYESTVKMKANN